MSTHKPSRAPPSVSGDAEPEIGQGIRTISELLATLGHPQAASTFAREAAVRPFLVITHEPAIAEAYGTQAAGAFRRLARACYPAHLRRLAACTEALSFPGDLEAIRTWLHR